VVVRIVDHIAVVVADHIVVAIHIPVVVVHKVAGRAVAPWAAIAIDILVDRSWYMLLDDSLFVNTNKKASSL
jgi:hypothetical protein